MGSQMPGPQQDLPEPENRRNGAAASSGAQRDHRRHAARSGAASSSGARPRSGGNG